MNDSMKRMRERLSENSKAGFTLIEVIIALTIFSVAAIPLLSSFTMASRLNMRGRQTEQAMTVAENVVEGVKAVGVDASYEWTKGTTEYSVVPNNSDGTAVTKSGTKATSLYTLDLSACETSRGPLGSAYSAVSFSVPYYTYKIEGILMGSTRYDVNVTAKINTENKDMFVPFAFSEQYTNAGMKIAVLYDIEAKVTLSGETKVLATYQASVVTKN